jgi:hypothetical protein
MELLHGEEFVWSSSKTLSKSSTVNIWIQLGVRLQYVLKQTTQPLHKNLRAAGLTYRLAWYCSLFICFLALYCTSTCIRIFGLLLPASQGGPSPVQFTAAGTNTLAAPAIAGLSAGPLRTAGPSWLMFASMPASHTCARPKNQTDAYAQHIAILGTKKKKKKTKQARPSARDNWADATATSCEARRQPTQAQVLTPHALRAWLQYFFFKKM